MIRTLMLSVVLLTIGLFASTVRADHWYRRPLGHHHHGHGYGHIHYRPVVPIGGYHSFYPGYRSSCGPGYGYGYGGGFGPQPYYSGYRGSRFSLYIGF